MNPFKDSIPEEQEKKTNELIALMRQAYHREQRRSRYGQQEIVARVGMRLEELQENRAKRAQKMAQGSLAASLQHGLIRGGSTKRVFGTLAAILVVSTLIGSTILLLIHAQARQIQAPIQAGPFGKPIGPVGKQVTITTTWSGLEMSMRVTPGPYFLGELLAIDLSLTNHTHPTLTLRGNVDSGECGSALYPDQTDGTNPHYALYTLPVPFTYNCPAIRPGNGISLAPGQTVAASFYELLTGSGDVTLTGNVAFYLSKTSNQSSPGPLAGHLPTLHIHVISQIPTDRALSFQQQDTRVSIQAPADLRLVDQTYILCQDSSRHSWPGGHEDWEPISTHTLQRPECSGQGDWTIVLWKYAIGAAGYAVVQGQS